jgi:alkanesulfonate monooxygenase SsuD/methylene tetrahydromethanopterin reductase-like flavin-dependent oxidoreductase (luciferase family)
LGFAEFADQATQLVPAGRLAEAIDLVPEAVVDTMTITGNVDQCARRIDEYEGVADELILARTGQPGDTNTLADYEDLFQLMRASGS